MFETYNTNMIETDEDIVSVCAVWSPGVSHRGLFVLLHRHISHSRRPPHPNKS